MDESHFLKVYPTPEELSSICSRVKCPQNSCNAVFQSTSNLNMHLIKHHKLDNNGLTKKDKVQYFCPSEACAYSKKHFTKLKYLKQHFLKVHALKNFVCKKCSKRFSTETFKTLHMKNCGNIFTCTCGSLYTSSEAILTHCKRKGKGHSFVRTNEKAIKNSTKKPKEIIGKKTERLIYPKLSHDMSFPIHYIAAVALSELSTPCNLSKVIDKGIQTDSFEFCPNKNPKSCALSQKFEKKRKSSQQTQTTGKLKKLKISAETQTNSDYLKQKVKNNFKSIPRKRKKSMETQTKDNTKADNSNSEIKQNISKRSNSAEMIHNSVKNQAALMEEEKIDFGEGIKSKIENIENADFDKSRSKKWLWDNIFLAQKDLPLARIGEVKNEFLSLNGDLNLCNKELNLNEYSLVSSKGFKNHYVPEQVSDNQIFDLNKLCNIETQTEIDSFLTECGDDTTFTLCSTTETQTTNDFDSLLYSNMCTQTCEEVDQLFNFNFVHIETQTTWPDLTDCGSLN